MIERMNNRETDQEVTTVTARLPGLDIHVAHQQGPGGEWEQVSIVARATPSFEAFGRSLEAIGPFKLWAQAAQLMWMPWLLLAQPRLLPGSRQENR